MLKRDVPITSHFGDPLATRKRGLAVKQKTVEEYHLAILDRDGAAVNLEDLENNVKEPLEVHTSFREASFLENVVLDDVATIVNKADGLVKFKLPSEVRNNAAIYLGEVGVRSASLAEREFYVINEFYVYVEPSNWSDVLVTTIPLAELRMSIRDSSLFENELLGNYEYDVAELSYAAARTVRYWNEIPPPVARFTTRAFPFTNLWITGTQLFLFDLIQEYYRRNQFPYSAGGLSVDDRNKFQLYRVAWADKMQQFTQDLQMLKARLNIEGASGTVFGTYRYYAI